MWGLGALKAFEKESCAGACRLEPENHCSVDLKRVNRMAWEVQLEKMVVRANRTNLRNILGKSVSSPQSRVQPLPWSRRTSRTRRPQEHPSSLGRAARLGLLCPCVSGRASELRGTTVQ